MTFDVKSKTLIIPGQLNVSFERKYDKKNGSLVQLQGSLGPFGNVNVTMVFLLEDQLLHKHMVHKKQQQLIICIPYWASNTYKHMCC